MQILGIVGSPRWQGNTHILVSKILDGAKDAGATVELLFLGGMTIRECDGCHACWKGKGCSKNDDMSELYEKIIASDALVFGTPVYWYGPTALLKGFVDRFSYFNCPENRAKIRGKSAVIAIPYEEKSPENAKLLLTFFEKSIAYLEMHLVGMVIVPGVYEKGEILKKRESLAKGYELGRSLVMGKLPR